MIVHHDLILSHNMKYKSCQSSISSERKMMRQKVFGLLVQSLIKSYFDSDYHIGFVIWILWWSGSILNNADIARFVILQQIHFLYLQICGRLETTIFIDAFYTKYHNKDHIKTENIIIVWYWQFNEKILLVKKTR